MNPVFGVCYSHFYRLNFLASRKATNAVTVVAATARMGIRGSPCGFMSAPNSAQYKMKTAKMIPPRLRKVLVFSVN